MRGRWQGIGFLVLGFGFWRCLTPPGPQSQATTWRFGLLGSVFGFWSSVFCFLWWAESVGDLATEWKQTNVREGGVSWPDVDVRTGDCRFPKEKRCGAGMA